LKAYSIAFSVVLFMAGCADPLEQPMVQEVPEKLQRGITGQGRLTTPDRSEERDIGGNHP
jgi:hypothetical protein